MTETQEPETEAQTAPTMLELIGDGDAFIHVRLEFLRYMRARHEEKFDDHVEIVRFMGGSFDGAVTEGRSRFEVNLFAPRDPDQRERDRPLFASLEFRHVALHYTSGARLTFRGTLVGSNALTPGTSIERDQYVDIGR